MSDLNQFLDQAWADHGDNAAAVAERLPRALDLVQDDDGVVRLAALAHHVLGEHLGQWPRGLDLLQQLADLGLHQADGGAAIARCQASLRLCAGQVDERPQLSASDRSRVGAMAAANLGVSQVERAQVCLQQAEADAAGLADADPGVRALAANANNLAVTLQELDALPAAQRGLMLQAAQLARRQWQRAGGWLELERADYRLALCWLAAGDAAQALQHARQCEAVVRAQGEPPLELFFAAEALALASAALGDGAAQQAALHTARVSFDALPADDQVWCRATLDRLASNSAFADAGEPAAPG